MVLVHLVSCVIPAKAGIQVSLVKWENEMSTQKQYFVYILASQRNGTLYIGVTSDLARRVSQHQQKSVESFTKKYGVDTLVYFEQTEDVRAALEREKCLKKWNRAWKIRLIEKENPKWKDLSLDW